MAARDTEVDLYSAPYPEEEKQFPIDDEKPSYSDDKHEAVVPFQLTVRAIAVGSVLGLIVCASNIYLGLKTGMYSPRPALSQQRLTTFQALRSVPPFSVPSLGSPWVSFQKSR